MASLHEITKKPKKFKEWSGIRIYDTSWGEMECVCGWLKERKKKETSKHTMRYIHISYRQYDIYFKDKEEALMFKLLWQD